MAKRIPVACTLGPNQAANQLGEWQALHPQSLGTERIAGGVRLRLPARLHATVEDLAQREQTCCAFLAISVTDEGDETIVEVTSDQPEAAPVIDVLTGLPAAG